MNPILFKLMGYFADLPHRLIANNKTEMQDIRINVASACVLRKVAGKRKRQFSKDRNDGVDHIKRGNLLGGISLATRCVIIDPCHVEQICYWGRACCTSTCAGCRCSSFATDMLQQDECARHPLLLGVKLETWLTASRIVSWFIWLIKCLILQERTTALSTVAFGYAAAAYLRVQDQTVHRSVWTF